MDRNAIQAALGFQAVSQNSIDAVGDRDFIAELKSVGRTIFLCTHNLDEADRLADHIGVMKQKLIQALCRNHIGRQDLLYGLFRSARHASL